MPTQVVVSPQAEAQIRTIDAWWRRNRRHSPELFSSELASGRRANGKTQTQVAALMQTSPAIVSRLESGHDVRVSTLEKYVAALGLRLEINAMPPKKPTTKASRTRRTKK